MNRGIRNIALGSTVALGLLAGCTTHYHQTADESPQAARVEAPQARNTVQYHDDASITSRVHAAVLGVPGIHAPNVQISTYDGVVTLRGTAVNEVAARNAVQAARQVTGVRSVEYDMQIQPY